MKRQKNPKTMKRVACVAATVLAFAGLSGAQQGVQQAASSIADQKTVAITVYNNNLGLVRETRELKLPRGVVNLKFGDVASAIDPTTVHIRSLTNAKGMTVLEQNYEYDLLSVMKLLDKYVGKKVTLVFRQMKNGTEEFVPTEAVLVSNNNAQPIYKIGEEYVVNPTNVAQIKFPKLPDNLIASPTLVWLLRNENDTQTVEASYLTSGMNWQSDYVLVSNPANTLGDLTGWVTINNQSGTEYPNAELKLVAGEVNRAPERQRIQPAMAMARAQEMDSKQFAEESFFEYHLYTLQRPATLKNNQTKQITLLDADGIKLSKEFVVNGQQYYYRGYNNPGAAVKEKVEVFLEVQNTKENNLGMALPAGRVRIYQADSSGSQQFIGEDRIDHTPQKEPVRVKVGNAFDLVAERKQTDYRVIGGSVYEYQYEISLRNRKKEPVTINVNEPIGGDWEMILSTANGAPIKAEKTSAFSARFSVPVLPDKEVKLVYRVRVRY